MLHQVHQFGQCQAIEHILRAGFDGAAEMQFRFRVQSGVALEYTEIEIGLGVRPIDIDDRQQVLSQALDVASNMRLFAEHLETVQFGEIDLRFSRRRVKGDRIARKQGI
jgi:hypothetical protein